MSKGGDGAVEEGWHWPPRWVENFRLHTTPDEKKQRTIMESIFHLMLILLHISMCSLWNSFNQTYKKQSIIICSVGIHFDSI